MRFRVAALLLPFLLGGSAGAQPGAGAFSGTLPAAIGDVSTWTVVSGEFDTGPTVGRYLFYVSPGLQGIYRLMRYDVQIVQAGNELERARRRGERVVYVARPGSREPLLCWERDEGLEPGSWRAVAPGTDAYRLEMVTLIRVLAAHRAARLQAGR